MIPYFRRRPPHAPGLAFVELLLAAAIICLLWIWMVRFYVGRIEQSRKAVCRTNARIIQGQLELYHVRTGMYPSGQKAFDRFLKNLDYFADEPACPLGTRWKYIVKTHKVFRHRH